MKKLNKGKIIIDKKSCSLFYENLFKNKWCILVKSKKNKVLQKKLSIFWKKLGCKVVFMQEQEHDKIFSVTSHLPHLIAYNLIKTAQDFQKRTRIKHLK